MNDLFKKLVDEYGYVFGNNILLFKKGPLSNWYGAYKGQSSRFELEIQISDLDFETFKFNCAEQAVMAMKAEAFEDWETLAEILKEQDPKLQQALGRKVKGFISSEWNNCKQEIYHRALFEKFRQNLHLYRCLESIPNFVIICEAGSHDKIWANGLDLENPDSLDVTKWAGQNLLGKTLSKVKTALADNPAYLKPYTFPEDDHV